MLFAHDKSVTYVVQYVDGKSAIIITYYKRRRRVGDGSQLKMRFF